MTTVRELPTRRYSQIRRLRRAGLMSAAAGPCEITGCAVVYPRPGARASYVYDHCHAHDYIRGVVCVGCNPAMAYLDARVMRTPGLSWQARRRQEERHAALLAHWARCPECAAGGAWEPYQTELEYERGQLTRTIVSLADEIAGRIPPRRVSPNVVPLREQLEGLERRLRAVTATE